MWGVGKGTQAKVEARIFSDSPSLGFSSKNPLGLYIRMSGRPLSQFCALHWENSLYGVSFQPLESFSFHLLIPSSNKQISILAHIF